VALRKRNLPHFQEADAVYFVTFRRKAEVDVDLTGAAAAEAIVGALRYFAGVRYRLYDYTVMPDHVHVILQPLARDGQFEPLHKIMHSIKSWTANQINRAVGRSGSLWLDESHDHVLRGPRDYREKARYIWSNPVQAGLIDDAAEWPWWGNGQREEGQE